MLLLHTSDWHLGHTWKGQSRREEFLKFFDWIIETIITHKVNILLIAGDIFDTSTPSPETQGDYFRFLKRLSETGCFTVIIAGNHDSAYLLDAPCELLSVFNVHVVGVPDNSERELIEVRGESGEVEMLIAAVPFLRDGDIRRFEIGESVESREQKIINGIKKHYAEICQKAESIRNNKPIPLVVSGHLFVDGGQTSEGVREIHVGTLGQVGIDLFPDNVDYFAFGHLHIPQIIKKKENYRYSGSPLPISFDEAEKTKSVVLVEFNGRKPSIKTLPVPKFVNVIHIEGGLDEINTAIKNLPKDMKSIVEISYNSPDTPIDLLNKVDEIVLAQEAPDLINVIRVRNNNVNKLQLSSTQNIPLERIDPTDLFRKLLQKNNFTETETADLLKIYNEVAQEINNP
jgi:exonuclease SbcD